MSDRQRRVSRLQPTKSCKTCAHFVSIDEAQGFCRRYPPKCPTVNYTQFPCVKADWWCGEYDAAK